jgi:hypothetical protein
MSLCTQSRLLNGKIINKPELIFPFSTIWQQLTKMYQNSIRIPAEWEPHSCCWMAWAVHSEWQEWAETVKSELSELI